MAEKKSKVFKCVYCRKPHGYEVNRCQEKDRFLFPPHKLLGKKIDDEFQIRAFIGESDVSVVYECQHISTEILYAIKFFKIEFSDLMDTTGSFEKFKKEAKDTEMIAHPNIVEVEKIDVTKDGIPYLIMELLEGSDLRSVLSKWGKLPLKDAGDIIAQVLDALNAVHMLGIIHGDLKPENIFLAKQTKGSAEAKILGFGVSKLALLIRKYMENLHPEYTFEAPYYISPEQARGALDTDHRVDLFSIGTILYELVTGIRPFQDERYEGVIEKIATQSPADPREYFPYLPAPVAEFINLSVAKDPMERFQSAQEMLRELKSIDFSSASPIATDPKKSKPSASPGRLNIAPVKEVTTGKHKDFTASKRIHVISFDDIMSREKKDPSGEE